ncbi:MAG: type II toxin-antitoxin system VapB family antitoxin [Candidatus Xenobiia bacterium LiM19]
MSANLAVDDNLISEAKRAGGHKTKKADVTEALKEYIQRRKQEEILNLFGKVEYEATHTRQQEKDHESSC